jgi:uncharacterized protein YukE
MTFSVDVEALPKLSEMIDRLKEDATAGQEYVTEHTKVQYQGFLNSVQGGHDHVVQEVSTWFGNLAGRVAEPTAAAVTDAVTYYQHSDAHAREALDSSYPEAKVEKAPEDYTYYEYTKAVAAFADKTEPQDKLREVEDKSGEFPYQPQWMDVGSPAQLYRDTIYEATALCAKLGVMDGPVDIYESLCKDFAGDWAGFAACKDVFDNLADECEDMGSNLHWAARSIESAWQGNAASACENYLFKVEDGVNEAVEPLRKLGDTYEQTAESMHELGGAMAGCISAVIDACIMAAANAAWGGATTEFGIGLIGDGIALYECYEVYDKIHEAYELYEKAKVLTELAGSTLTGMGDLSDTHANLPTLPTNVPTMPSMR